MSGTAPADSTEDSCRTGGKDASFRRCFVLDSERLDASVFRLDVSWRGAAPAPGQFFMLRPARGSRLLGRPISVYRWEYGSCLSCGDGRLSFIIAERGSGSAELGQLRQGEPLDLTGPLGNAWPSAATQRTPGAATTTAGAESRHPGPGAGSDGTPGGNGNRAALALVGGGVGLAPLAFLASGLVAESYDFYAGFREAPYGLDGLAPRRLTVASEGGRAEHTGRIPEFFVPGSYDAVYACGPTAMMKAIAASCAEAGIPCHLSLEGRMACGVGACLGCTVRTVAGNRRCCADGPIFAAEELLLDEL